MVFNGDDIKRNTNLAKFLKLPKLTKEIKEFSDTNP